MRAKYWSILFLLVTIFSPGLKAAVTEYSITGASVIDTTTSAPSIIIYGGNTASVSGVLANCTAADSYSTCDTCQGGTNVPCNYASIYPNLILKIQFTTDNKELIAKNPTVYLKNGSTSISANAKGTSSTGVYYFETTWATICSAVSSTNTVCESNINSEFTLGLSTNSGEDLSETLTLKIITSYVSPASVSTNTNCTASSITSSYQGACGMTLFPGDEKVYVDEVIFDNLFPDVDSSGVLEFKRVMFFFEQGASATITNGSLAAEFNVTKENDEYKLSDNKIDGLENGQTYCFRMASQDVTGNIYRFAADADIVCKMPEEVVGLLDDKKCFIATAAFGTSLDEHVQLFRKFRDEVLLNNTLGKIFVRTYYKYGPIAANWISQSEVSKFMVRTLLWPLWLIVYMYFEFGLILSLLIILGVCSLIYHIFKNKNQLLVLVQSHLHRFKNKNNLIIFVLLFSFQLQSIAQQSSSSNDGPPREPPYTDVIEDEDPEALKMAEKLNKQEPSQNSDQKESQTMTNQEPPQIFVNKNVRKQKIKHPWAEKGLTKIHSDGTYYFKTDLKQAHAQTFSFKFGNVQAPGIVSADEATSFSDMYKQSSLTQMNFEYEWFPFTNYGKLGLQTGFGFFYAQGNGRFKSDNSEAREEYTFFALPVSIGFTYRLEWLSRQWIAPYLGAGPSYYVLFEHRDDNKSNNFVGTAAGYGVLGAMLNLTAFDQQISFDLNSEYGIRNLWLNMEYKIVQSFSEDLDLSTNNLYFGFSLDY